MRKLSLILALFLVGCVVGIESEDTVEDEYTSNEEEKNVYVPGQDTGGTNLGCGSIYVEKIQIGDEIHYMEIPIPCDSFWWVHTPPGDPPPESGEIDLYSNPVTHVETIKRNYEF